jgi:glutaredoxin 2
MKLIIFFFFLLNKNSFAEIECGKYQLRGFVIESTSKTGLYLLLNEKTTSEYRFKIGLDDESSIFPYLDQDIQLIGNINKKANGYNAEVVNIEQIKVIAPEVFNLSKVDALFLLKKKKCKK